MYAVIETGGKQYRVEVGTELEVELLDAEPGGTITLDRVLLVADGDDASIGRPIVSNAAVSAEVLRQARGDKVIAFKYRPKARRRVKKGHRQELTILRISDITLDGKSAAKVAKKAEADARTERMRLEEAAREQAAADAELAAKLAVRQAPKAEAEPGTETPAKTPKKSRARSAEAEPPAKAEKQAEAQADTAKGKKRTTAKAASSDADEAPETKPKRTRATKKDE